jgi:hypothetical protein
LDATTLIGGGLRGTFSNNSPPSSKPGTTTDQPGH